jgi:hypothetical protein
MKDDREDWEKRLDKKTAGLDPEKPDDRIKIMHAHMAEVMRRAGRPDLAKQTERVVGLSGTSAEQGATKKWWQFWK